MPQAIGRRSLFSTCFLLLAADSSSAFYFPSFPPNLRFGDVFVSVKKKFFFFKSTVFSGGVVADQRPDEVGVKYLCVCQAILHYML